MPCWLAVSGCRLQTRVVYSGRVDYWREVVQRSLSWRAPKLRLSHDLQHGSVAAWQRGNVEGRWNIGLRLYHTTGPP